MELLAISLLYSPDPRQVRQWDVSVPAGSTVVQAIAASGLLLEFPDLAAGAPLVGIWGKRTSLRHVVQHQDRLEIYRPLRVDPKIARRERFNKQGARKSGLFAKKRAGAKAGY